MMRETNKIYIIIFSHHIWSLYTFLTLNNLFLTKYTIQNINLFLIKYTI